MPAQREPDKGSILPIVLVIVVVLGLVVIAVADYATTTLSYGQVVESRNDRVAASQAAMDDAIEQLELKRGFSICATGTGGSGVTHPFPEEINGASATVTCGLVGGELPTNEGFALVVTGQGVDPSVLTLELMNGGKPTINGPIYVHDPARSTFNQPTTIEEGDYWYEDPTAADTCAIPDPSKYVAGTTAFERSTITIPRLSFDPPLTRGYYCINRSWNQLFSAPTVDSTLGSLAPPVSGPTVDDYGCKVFEPGYYDTAPVLDTNNYFKSGVYHFDNVGHIIFNKNVATFGNSLMQGFPVIDNDPCDPARTGDSTDGATVYTSGNTQFDMDKTDTGLEIAGRIQGNQVVAMHVLSTSLNPTTDGLIQGGSGAKREVALNGFLWAPNSALIFETIPSQKAAALRGGAVVARLKGRVSSAGDDNFVIEISTSSGNTQLLLESTATNDRGSTSVRVVADYRSSSGEVAMRSWRVCEPSGC